MYVSRMLDAYNDSKWRTSEVEKAANATLRLVHSSEPHQHRPISHGRFTSPHLIDRWDCITINQRPVSWTIFHAVESRVKERNDRERIGASEFELLTATAFEIFNDAKIDIGVVEVGMGGLQDATNIIGATEGLEIPANSSMESFRPMPLVTAISSISLDHQAFLGNTLAEIARQKAGIIKRGVPVVFGESLHLTGGSMDDYAVDEVIKSVAAEVGSPIINLGGTDQHSAPTFESQCLSRLQEIAQKHGMKEHQYRNAMIAFTATWSALQQLGRVPSDPVHGNEVEKDDLSARLELAKSMMETIPTTIFPGRQQLISIEQLTGRSKPVLLDGAHNRDSSNALAPTIINLRRSVPTIEQTRPVTWVIALSDSKDPREVFGALLEEDDAVFAVEFGQVDGMPWVKPLPSQKLISSIRSWADDPSRLSLTSCGSDLLKTLQSATEVSEEGPMVIAGSLYLVQDVLRLLRTKEQENASIRSVDQAVG